MGKANNGRGERALRAMVGALDQARGALAHRLDEIDLEDMRKRGTRMAGSVRTDLQRRVRPRRRRVSPWGVVGIHTVDRGGVVADPALVDAAVERVHGVPGVVAVVNLTTGTREGASQLG